MPEQEVPSDAEGDHARHRLREGLKCCRSMVDDYREMIGRAVDDSFRPTSDDSSAAAER